MFVESTGTLAEQAVCADSEAEPGSGHMNLYTVYVCSLNTARELKLSRGRLNEERGAEK